MTTAITTITNTPVGYVIVSNSVWHIYTSLMQWMNSLKNRDPTL